MEKRGTLNSWGRATDVREEKTRRIAIFPSREEKRESEDPKPFVAPDDAYSAVKKALAYYHKLSC